jgi:hypothetical protein
MAGGCFWPIGLSALRVLSQTPHHQAGHAVRQQPAAIVVGWCTREGEASRPTCQGCLLHASTARAVGRLRAGGSACVWTGAVRHSQPGWFVGLRARCCAVGAVWAAAPTHHRCCCAQQPPAIVGACGSSTSRCGTAHPPA